jgi:uncharacterized membrane protein YdjX (TVP38/TMEM64 family)
MEPRVGRRQVLKNTLIIAILVAISVLLITSSHVLSSHFFETLSRADFQITHYVHTHKIYSALVFSLVFVLAATLSLPVESAMCILAGYYFHPVLGMVISIFSIAIGATVMFLAVHRYFRDWFRSRFQSPTIDKIMHSIGKDAFSYILFLRLIPLFPPFVTNTALALSTVRTRDYILATFIGVIPAAAILVLAGSQLESIKRTGQILSPDSLGILLLLGFFSLLPLVWRMFFSKETS